MYFSTVTDRYSCWINVWVVDSRTSYVMERDDVRMAQIPAIQTKPHQSSQIDP